MTRLWLHGAHTNHPLLSKIALPFRSIGSRVVHRIDPTPFSNVMLQNPDSVSVCLDNIFRAARLKKFDYVYTSLYILKLSLVWSQCDTQGKLNEGNVAVHKTVSICHANDQPSSKQYTSHHKWQPSRSCIVPILRLCKCGYYSAAEGTEKRLSDKEMLVCIGGWKFEMFGLDITWMIRV